MKPRTDRKMDRQLFLLLTLCILSLSIFSLPACDDSGDDDDDNNNNDTGDDDSGDDDTGDDDDNDNDDIPTRSFRLSAAPMQYEMKPYDVDTVFDTSGFEGHVDILSLHMDSFFGFPWQAFMVGDEPPDVWVNVMEDIRDQADNLGVDVFLSLTPLDGMRGMLAPYAREEGGELVIDTTGWNACFNFQTGESAATIRNAYLAYVRWMVDFFKPTYLCHVIEMNLFADSCPDSYESLAGLANEVYQQEKAINPDLVIFPSFTLPHYYQYYMNEGGCIVDDTTCFQQSLARDASILRDRFGISSYPQFYMTIFEDFPDDYFLAVQELTGEKIVFAETGAGSYSVTFPYPALEDPCTTLFPWSTENQIALMQSMFEDAQEMEADLFVWWSLRDFLPVDVATHCPCDAEGLWCLVYEAVYDMGLLASWLHWGTMGVYDYQLVEKPLMNTWRDWLSRPIAD